MSFLLRPRRLGWPLLVIGAFTVLSCFLAVEPARAAAACSKVTTLYGSPNARLVTALRLDLRHDARPTATSTVTVDVPAVWPEVAVLREELRVARQMRRPFFHHPYEPNNTPPTPTAASVADDWPQLGDGAAIDDLESRASSALDCLVPGLAREPVAFGNETYSAQLAISTSGGRAKVVAVTRTNLDELGTARASQASMRPWQVRQSGANLLVAMDPPAILAGAGWSGVLDVEGASRIGSIPTPADDDGRTHVQWSAEHLPTNAKLQAVVGLPWLTALRVGSEHKLVPHVFFLTSQYFLAPLILVLLTIAAHAIRPSPSLVAPGRTVAPLPPGAAAPNRRAWLLALVALLLILMALPLLYGGYRTSPEEPLWKSSAILLGFVAFYLCSGGGLRNQKRTVLLALLVLGGLLLPAGWDGDVIRAGPSSSAFDMPAVWLWVRLVLIMLLLVSVTYWAVWGTMRLVDRLLRTGGLVVSDLRRTPGMIRWARRATVAVVAAFALGIVEIAATRLRDQVAGVHSAIELVPILPGTLLVYPVGVAVRLFDFLPFLALTALLALLHAARESSVGVLLPRYPRARLALALIFAGFVVGVGGELYGIALPISFLVGMVALIALLGNRLEAVETTIAGNDTRLRNRVGAIIVDHQAELLARAKDIDLLRRSKAAAYAEHAADRLDHDAYQKRLETLNAQIERIRKEGSPSYAANDRILLPQGLWPHALALTVGPAGSWWNNGVEAAKAGLVAALAPLAIYLYVLITRVPSEVWTFLGGVDIIRGLLQEMAFWLVGAFVLGCAYAHLPGENGMLKGLTLTAVYALASAAGAVMQSWAGNAPDTGWIFRGWELLLFLSLVAIWLDRQTITKRGLYWRDLLDSYRVRPARAAVTYLVPLVVSLIGIGQQLLSGDAQNALVEVIKSLSNLIPVG